MVIFSSCPTIIYFYIFYWYFTDIFTDICTDTGIVANKIDFLTDVVTSANTDNLNGKVAKMRIDPNGHLLHHLQHLSNQN